MIRRFTVTSAAAHDGAQLPDVLDKSNSASAVWADIAYRSKANEANMARHGFASKVHCRRARGVGLIPPQARANAARSKGCSALETVFAAQKHRFGLFIRTIGAARAKTKIGLANIVYNASRMLWLHGRTLPA